MRILYVALTRAKEKLIITGVSNDFTKKIEDIEKQENIYLKKDGKINHILVKKYKSYLDWILLVYLYEKENTKNLIELKIIEPNQILNEKKEEINTSTSNKIIKILDQKEYNEDLIKDIKTKIEYEYQNKLATTIPTKSSVTKIKQMKNKQIGVDFESLDDDVDFAQNEIIFEKPKFLQDDVEQKISSTQKGTLFHLCMQKLNLKEEYDLKKIKNLIENLQLKQIISEKEAESINPFKILEFTKSNIWQQLKTAKEIHQEKPFYINIPARQIFEQDVDEVVLVQGIIDLFFIDANDNIILLDFKTDFVENGNEKALVDKYRRQLELYKLALEGATGKSVNRVFIYSVWLGKEIEV